MLQPDGQALIMVRVPVRSFVSGDANRDAHMRETLEEDKYGYVVFKAATSLHWPVAQSSTKLDLAGQLDFHGQKHPLTAPVEVQPAKGAWTVRGAFDVSFDAFGVNRPSLLFVKIDDRCKIELDLTVEEASP